MLGDTIKWTFCTKRLDDTFMVILLTCLLLTDFVASWTHAVRGWVVWSLCDLNYFNSEFSIWVAGITCELFRLHCCSFFLLLLWRYSPVWTLAFSILRLQASLYSADHLQILHLSIFLTFRVPNPNSLARVFNALWSPFRGCVWSFVTNMFY